MSTATGTYFSGDHLTGEAATFDCSDRVVLRITTAQRTLDVPFAEIRVSDRLGHTARYLYLPGRAVLETLDNDTVDAWLVAQERGRAAALIHFLESHRGVATAACALVVMAIMLGLYFGPPKLARALAMRVPPAIEERAGKVALASLAQFCRPSTLSAAERARVARQLARVVTATPAHPAPSLEFRSMPLAPNAMALPGGTIVIADELVRLPATDDEIAAVLAHEIGHLEYRHGFQAVLRNSFALLFVSGVTGDLSVLTSFVAALPLTILTNGYSRDLEREADRYALQTLRHRGIPTKSFSTALFKLEQATAAKQAQRNVSYLSTHPSDDERMALFGALSDKDKEALNNAIAPTAKPSGNNRGTSPAAIAVQPTRRFDQKLTTATADRVDTQPVALKRTPPVYPENARRAGTKGQVVVDFVVDVDGSVANPYAASSTNPIFEPAAVAAVRDWRFTPGRKDGQPVPVHMQVPIVFTLDDQTAKPAAPLAVPARGGT